MAFRLLSTSKICCTITRQTAPIVSCVFGKKKFRSFHSSCIRQQELNLKTSPKVEKIVNEVVELNIMETLQLVNILKDKFGYQEQVFAAAAAPAAAEVEEEEEEEEEQVVFNVLLTGWHKRKKIPVIKEVRKMTGLGLKQAKELVEEAASTPQMIKESIGKPEAEEILETIKKLGGECKME